MASTIAPFDTNLSLDPQHAQQAQAYVKQLREALDRGEIEVSQFLQEGKKAAQFAVDTYLHLAPHGKASADRVNWIMDSMRTGEGWSGLKVGAGNEIKPTALGKEYEERLRQELIPENIQGAERDALLKSIPNDIGFDTDRFQAEREGIRQKFQQQETLTQQKEIQKNRLGELATLLGEQEKRQFNESVPELAGNAQTAGFLETSGFGNALARERARLAGNTQTVLGLQALDDRDFEVNAIGDIAKNLNSFQTAGLERQFGLQDRDYSENLAKELARLANPEIKQPSSLERALPFIGLGTSAATAYASGGASARKPSK